MEGSQLFQQRHLASRSLVRWVKFGVLVIFTAVCLVPIALVVFNAFVPSTVLVSGGASFFSSHLTLANFQYVFEDTQMLLYLRNSVITAAATAALAIIFGAPAAFVLSRSRRRVVSLYSFSLFVAQTFPVVVFLIPLFIIFRPVGLDNSLQGLVLIYLAGSIPFSCWMLRAYFDTIPVELEEAAWMDGCSLLGGFFRIVLRNAGPGLVSAALFSFLAAWNDYLVADVILRSTSILTMPVGLESFFQEYSTEWGAVMASAVLMMAPPVILFGVLHRYFNVGGVGGALAGT
jgi:multiple sugar transport system permease protein